MSAVHLHLLLNHVPVIGTLLALCLLAYAALRRDDGVARVSLGLFALLTLVAIAVFLTGEPAEEAVEGLAGVPESLVERHEEAALLSTIALGVMGGLSLAALFWFRRRAIPRTAALLLLAAALLPAGAMAWTASLGGQIRHSEIRPGAAALAEIPGENAELVEQSDDDRDR